LIEGSPASTARESALPTDRKVDGRIMKALSRHLRALASASDRLLWAVRVRWLVIFGFFGLAAAAWIAGSLASLEPCARAALVGLALNGANHLCLKRATHVVAVTAVAIPLDHVLITYVVVHTGGIESPFLMMYFVQVVTTAMLVDTGVAVASAGIAVVAWVAGDEIAAAGLAGGGFEADAASPISLRSLWAAFLLYCLGLLVYVGGYIGQRLRSSEQNLEEKNLRLRAALDSLGRAYEQLKQTEGRLVHSEKMRSLGQLVAGVAHELNNPISFISANVEHLRTYTDRLAGALRAYETVDLAPPVRARIARIHEELRVAAALADLPGLLDDCEEGARRTKEIVSELRTFSRNDDGAQWRIADVRHGIDTTLGLLSHRLKNRVTLHKDYGVVPDVECLPGQINQVFMNLLANAADAVGERAGNIWITVVAAGADAAKESVVITVRDDGAGMDAEVCARAFEPFFTTKEIGRGTGLGLAVSYAIVQRHRGSIGLTSRPGVGTTFTLRLPVRQVGGGESTSSADAGVDSHDCRG
jgi:signal transduction histidine kinase